MGKPREKTPINKLLQRAIHIPMPQSSFVQLLDAAREIEKEEKEKFIQAFIDGGDHEALTKSNSVRQDGEDYFDKTFTH